MQNVSSCLRKLRLFVQRTLYKPEDYERRFSILPGKTKPNYPKLRSDELGICVYPSIHAEARETSREPVLQSPRDRRMVSFNY